MISAIITIAILNSEMRAFYKTKPRNKSQSGESHKGVYYFCRPSLMGRPLVSGNSIAIKFHKGIWRKKFQTVWSPYRHRWGTFCTKPYVTESNG